MVKELRARKNRIRFHFYYGNSLELCFTTEEWLNKFHVMHCSKEFTNYVGLQNLLPIAIKCLNGNFRESVLLTELYFYLNKRNEASVEDFITSEMSCPLSMIPTIYGVKLLDHVRLGYSACTSLHDHFHSKSGCTVKWSKAPVTYSTNIEMEFTPDLQSTITEIAERCFYNSEWFSNYTPENYRKISHLRKNFNRNTALTFYYIFQSFFSRHNLTKFFIENYNQHCLPPNFQLAWKTIKQWMNGKEVLLYYTTDKKMLEAILKEKDTELEISIVQFVLKSTDPNTHYRKGQVIDDNFFTGAQSIFNLRWNEPNNDLVISFLLSKDNGLDKKSTKLFVIEYRKKKILYSVYLRAKSMQRQNITNPKPNQFPLVQPPYFPPFPIRCHEDQAKYTLILDKQSIKFPNIQGITDDQQIYLK